MLTGNTAGDINDHPSIIWFTSDTDKAMSVLKPIAEEFIKQDKDFKFFYAKDDEDDDDIISSLRSFAGLKKETTFVLLDIPEQEVWGGREGGEGREGREGVSE